MAFDPKALMGLFGAVSMDHLSKTVRSHRNWKLWRRFPATEAAMKQSRLLQRWWYYTVELLPGVMVEGAFPGNIPFLPRLMMRRCDLAGMDCLDLGTMEGLVPTLMKRGGAGRVLAVDAIDHCREKMAAVRHYYGVDFDFQAVGLMYDLDRKIKGGFDFINCSGLLYHVFSPIHVLASVRPLLKRNGLMIVSTNVVNEPGYFMAFNDGGRLQEELNTFWYLSVEMLDYILRYLHLAPLDAAYLPHSPSLEAKNRYTTDRPSGYLAVVCRAVDEAVPAPGDGWMRESSRQSWESLGLVDWHRAQAQPRSDITYCGNPERVCWRQESDSLDLWRAVQDQQPVPEAAAPQDAHILRLEDRC